MWNSRIFKPKINNSDGFTFIEVMMATAILGFALMVISLMLTKSSVNNRRSEGMTTALVCGTDLIEQINSWDYTDARLVDLVDNGQNLDDGFDDDPSLMDGTDTDSNANGGTTAYQNGKYLVFYNVQDNDITGDGSSDYKTIRLFVRAQASTGGFQVMRLDYIKANI